MRKSYRVHVGLNGVYNGDDEFMAGESIMFSGPANKIPAGYLIEDGSAVGRVAYATLFAAIGTTYGAGDGASTFNVPDSRGEFWRGLDLGRGVDAARAVGSAQGDMFKEHDHSGTQLGGVDGHSGNAYQKSHASGNKTGLAGGHETRPRNLAKIPLIKY